MPTHNGASTLPAALESLLLQTYDDYEILIYDDGSQDETASVLDRFSSMDKRVRVVGTNRVGLVQALRTTIDASDSEFIARMDDDDLNQPERLAEQVTFLQETPAISLVSCLIRCFPEEQIAMGMRHYEAWLNSLTTPQQIERDIFIESPICHPSVLMRRRAYDQTEGYLDDSTPEDYGLWLQFQAHGLKMAKVPRLLFSWRDTQTRLTRTDPRYGSDRFIALKLRHLRSSVLRDKSAVSLWGAGQHGRRWSRALSRVGIPISAFVDVDPKKIGKRIHGVPVISHEELRHGRPRDFLLVAVGAQGARTKIRRFLDSLGLADPFDFVCIA